MNVLIAGGRGFLGAALGRELRLGGHHVTNLTRGAARGEDDIHWDGTTSAGWTRALVGVDAVVNATGYGLEHWPWTRSRKRRFVDSRVEPGRALSSAIAQSTSKPAVFLQISGINYYGLRGESPADETTAAADDFLARLSVAWEAASRPVEDLGVRRVVARSAVVLAAGGGLFPLMALPARLFTGGPLGDGKQAVPWIHIGDYVAALRFLLEHENSSGPYNVVAPTLTSNEHFMRAVAFALRRPYWFPAPAPLLRLVLGEMSVLVLEGRQSIPSRLDAAGFRFRFPTIEAAAADLFKRA